MTAQGYPTTQDPLPHVAGRTLAEGLATSDNALNLIRLVLSLVVLVSHTQAASGVDPGTRLVDDLGHWAVNGFFIISGYLIVASRLRSSWYSYLIRRAARIYPAFWAHLLVVAFVLAPIVGALGAGIWRPGSAAAYVLQNVTLFNQFPGFPGPEEGAFEGIILPVFPVWNASTWTLMYELLAYLACWAIFSIPWCRRHVALTAGVMVAGLFLANLWGHENLGAADGFLINSGRLGLCFAMGALAYGMRDRIRVRWWIWGVAVIACAVLYLLPRGLEFAFVPLAYAVLAGGVLLPWRVGARTDISYGVYVYGFPIQQVMTVLGVAQLGWTAHLVASMIVSIGAGFASWHLVEKPGMEGGRRLIDTIRRRAGQR